MPATHAKLAQGVESRERLLVAAEDLLGRGGYGGTSVDAIARSAGVVKTAIYHHFGSKQGLALAALQRYTTRWVQEVEALTSGAADPTERLDRLVGRVRSVFIDAPAAQRMVFTLLLERGDGDPECREIVRQLFRGLRASLAHGLRKAVPVLSPERAASIANTFVAMSDGLLLQFLAEQDIDVLDTGLADVRRCLVLQIEQALRGSA